VGGYCPVDLRWFDRVFLVADRLSVAMDQKNAGIKAYRRGDLFEFCTTPFPLPATDDLHAGDVPRPLSLKSLAFAMPRHEQTVPCVAFREGLAAQIALHMQNAMMLC
jgi:hypothetical protein